LALITSDAVATALQKADATCGPTTEPPGIRGLLLRCSSIQANGSFHCPLVCGPVGPLLKPLAFCPQCP
jgi:hypothetical protein